VPVWPNGYAEPMTALYMKSRLPLGPNIPSMRSMLEAMEACFVDVNSLGVDLDSFLNINSPSDLKAAETRLKQRMGLGMQHSS
jgi:molybdopterin-guanine dinucleotide biosynthesis protein A